jgi:hypothetical protein
VVYEVDEGLGVCVRDSDNLGMEEVIQIYFRHHLRQWAELEIGDLQDGQRNDNYLVNETDYDVFDDCVTDHVCSSFCLSFPTSSHLGGVDENI